MPTGIYAGLEPIFCVQLFSDNLASMYRELSVRLFLSLSLSLSLSLFLLLPLFFCCLLLKNKLQSVEVSLLM